MWLLALNEMQRKEYEAEQRAKEREQREVQIQQGTFTLFGLTVTAISSHAAFAHLARKSSVSTPPATQKNDVRRACAFSNGLEHLSLVTALQASLKILEEIKSGKILQLSSSPEIASSPKVVSSSPDDDETAASQPTLELSQSKEREKAVEKVLSRALI